MNRPMVPRALLCCLAVAMATAGTARGDDWTSLGLQGERTRLSGEQAGPTFGGAAWEHRVLPSYAPAHRQLLATPAIGDGYVVVATQRHLVHALREADGRLLWEAPAGDAVRASPAIWRGLAFVLGSNQQLYALRLRDGSVVWQRPVGGIGYASPAVVDGSVYVATGIPTPRVMRLDAATGETRWQAGEGLLRKQALASLAVSGGRVLVGESGGRYHSFSSDDGRWQWTALTGGTVGLSSALVAGDRVHLLPGGDQARLHTVELATGKALPGWPLEIPMPGHGAGQLVARGHLSSSPAGTGELVVFSLRSDDRIDRDGDGQAETFLMQQQVVAVDGQTRRVLWSAPAGRLETRDVSRLPAYGFISTPALFRTAAGETLVAATSSLEARVRILQGGSGAERWSAELSGPTRSSPVFANGRLVVATDAGAVHSFLSDTNEPPVAPSLGLSPGDGREISAGAVVLRWGMGFDPESALLRYEVRLDDDGEVLRDWDLQTVTAPGQQSWSLSPLPADRVYTFAIRARDPQGAYSAWSRSETFRALAIPDVRVDGVPALGLAEALAAARPGQVISLGAGVLRIGQALEVPAGVSLAGAGPHLTVLEGKGLPVAIAPASGSTVEHLTVSGARVGVAVEASRDVRLHHVILRDNTEAGLQVGGAGSASLVSATVVRNGTGVWARGATQVRNALVTDNEVGLDAGEPGLLTSRFNDVYGNRTGDYRNVERGAHDLAMAVRFATDRPDELLLAPQQPTTDRGDPADDFSQEPLPNGGRINIGAFGNTIFAELSAIDGLAPPPPPGAPPTMERPRAGGGCSLGGSGSLDPAVLMVLAGLLARRARRATRRGAR